jgi:SET domain-containing protein
MMIAIVARRDIAPGDELLLDYGPRYFRDEDRSVGRG